MANQENGSQGQEPGTGTGGQAQEAAQQNGQENGTQQSQGQEPGQESGQGQADISKMSPEELATYAAKLQKDAEEARREAANYRTRATSAEGKITEAERAQMTELEKAQSDIQERDGKVQTLTEENTSLKAQVEDLTRGAGIREALSGAGALNPVTAFKVGAWDGVKMTADGKVDPESFKAAVAKLRETDPYLFRRTASADAGAGRGGESAPDASSGINDAIRGAARR